MAIFSMLSPHTNRTSWVKKNGLLYKPSCAVVLRIENDYPLFGQVQNIYVVDSNDVFLSVKLLVTFDYYAHCHAYLVSVSHTIETVRISSLFSVFPLMLRNLCVHGHLHRCVVVKHHILHSLQC